MGLFAVLFAALAVWLLIWRIGRLSTGAALITGAALSLGLIGYSVSGSPNQPSAPVAKKAEPATLAPSQNNTREALIGKFGSEADSLAQADAYFRINRPDLAARVLQISLKKSPNNPALWTGLGNAMVGHGAGVLSPAAEYCYRRALEIVPDYPGALYFYGVALSDNGRRDDARSVFARLVQTIPVDAPFRSELMDQLRKADLLPQKTAPFGVAPK